MYVKDLPLEAIRIGRVRIAPTVFSIVRNNNCLMHMVVERECHVVECFDIPIESRNREHIRSFS